MGANAAGHQRCATTAPHAAVPEGNQRPPGAAGVSRSAHARRLRQLRRPPATPPATAAPNNIGGTRPGRKVRRRRTEIPAYSYNFQGVDVNQVLDLYADLVGRTILRAGLPQASIVLHTQSLLTRSEAIQALQAVLALNGISLINVGDKFVKALPSTDANTAGRAVGLLGRDQFAGAGVIRDAHCAVEIRQAQRNDTDHPAVRQIAEFDLWRLTATASSSSATTPKM